MKKIIQILFLSFALLGVMLAQAQNVNVSGKVTDASTGEPLPGVNISVKGTVIGVITDNEGNYLFKIPSQDVVLLFSFIGYETQEIELNGDTSLDVVLKENFASLEEVVVVGYGTQLKSKVTSSISTVNAEHMSDRPITSVTEGLMASVPGLIISYGSGRPGDDPSINIRGRSTIGKSSGVLVLIDGIEGSLANIDPNSIENVSVLKDAGAASIYGARAANGVMLITTKSGGKNKDVSVTYRANIGFEEAYKVPELVSGLDFMLMKNKALDNVGALPEYGEEILNMVRSGQLEETDWTKELYGEAALQTNHSLLVSGGTQKSSFAISLGYLDQQGIVTGTDDYQRYNLRVRVDTDISNWLTIGTNTALTNRTQNFVPIETGRVLRAAPFYPVTLDDGTYVVGQGGDSSNPYLTTASGQYNLDDRDIMKTQLYAKIKLPKGFSFEEKVSFRSTNLKEKDWRNDIDYVTLNVGETGYVDTTYVNALPTSRTLRYEDSKSLRITTQSMLRYENTSENHFINGLLGFQTEENRSEGFQAGRIGFLNSSVHALGLGEAVDPGIDGFGNNSSASGWSIASAFGRLNYDYKKKYIAEFSFRYDGSSRFANGHKWGFFPSASVGWNMGSENFIQNLEVIDLLKLRASWGQLGDAFKVGAYDFLQTVAQNSGYGWPEGQQPALVTGDAANPLITWETATIINGGIDASLWGGKLGIQTDYFINKRSDILGTPDVPTEFGLGAPAQNVRDVKSWGWEVSLTHKNKIGDFNYDIAVNISDQKNKLTSLGSTFEDIGNTVIMLDEPINARYGYRSDGLIADEAELAEYTSTYNLQGVVIPTIGSVRLKDISGPDGIPDNVISAEYDREIYDDNINHYRVGGRIKLAYKGLSLTAIINGVLDRQILFRGAQSEFTFSGGVGTPFAFNELAFDPDKPDRNAPIPILKPDLVNFDQSDYWLRDAAFIRMQNINLSYSFDRSLLKNFKIIKDLSVYTSIENAFLIWTNYFAYDSGWDPELGAGAVDYPLSRTVSFGLNVTF
jgi:TonB-linked SusC/RagA family outer membrane protein